MKPWDARFMLKGYLFATWNMPQDAFIFFRNENYVIDLNCIISNDLSTWVNSDCQNEFFASQSRGSFCLNHKIRIFTM